MFYWCLTLLLLISSLSAQNNTPAVKPTPEPSAAFTIAYRKASESYVKGDYTSAAAQIDEALKLDPNSGQALSIKGAVLTKQGNIDEAKAIYQRSIKLLPGRWEPRFNLIELVYIQKRYTEARNQYLELQKEFPKEAAITFRIFLTYLHDGKEAEAQKIVEAADPFADHPLYYITRACLAFSRKDEVKAADWIQSANQMYSADKLYYFVDCMVDEGWIRRSSNP